MVNKDVYLQSVMRDIL